MIFMHKNTLGKKKWIMHHRQKKTFADKSWGLFPFFSQNKIHINLFLLLLIVQLPELIITFYDIGKLWIHQCWEIYFKCNWLQLQVLHLKMQVIILMTLKMNLDAVKIAEVSQVTFT